MIEMKLTAAVTLAALGLTFVLSGKVGQMRGKHGIKAPATTGNDEFERAFRAHANTVEQLVLLLPVLWLSTQVVGDLWAALLGVVWIVGRVLYAKAYINEPSSRGTGMLITVAPTAILTLITAVGIIISLF